MLYIGINLDFLFYSVWKLIFRVKYHEIYQFEMVKFMLFFLFQLTMKKKKKGDLKLLQNSKELK